jgi:hypothetical protein
VAFADTNELDALVGPQLSPARIEFEQAEPGCIRSAEVLLTNLGATLAGPPTLALTGIDASQFAIASHTCDAALPAGASCAIQVDLSPTTTGSFMASLEATLAGRVASSELIGRSAFDGCGWPPTLLPNSHDFGVVTVGASSAPQTFRVTNRGGEPLGVLRVGLRGVGASSFSVTRDLCDGTTLAGGLSCELDVVMMPGTAGELIADLEVSVDGGGMASAALSGRAEPLATSSSLMPSTADFGARSIGETSPTTTFTVLNTGASPTGVLDVRVAGTNPDDFVIETASSTCLDAPIPALSSCVVVLAFAPTAAGARAATLRVQSSPGGSATAALTGTGL